MGVPMKILFFSIDPELNFKKVRTLTFGFCLMLVLSLLAALKLNHLDAKTYLSYVPMIFAVGVNFYFAYRAKDLRDVEDIKRAYLNWWIEAVLLFSVYVIVTRFYRHNFSLSRVDLGMYVLVACIIIFNSLKRRKKVRGQKN